MTALSAVSCPSCGDREFITVGGRTVCRTCGYPQAVRS